jgi:hypothetical protein
MEMTPVNSSNIGSIGYDPETATLRIQFVKGGIYDYQGVPQDVYEGLLSSGSKGNFVNEFIKKAGYPCIRLS